MKTTRTIAVIMPNRQDIGINTPWRNFRVSIDRVEALTGLVAAETHLMFVTASSALGHVRAVNVLRLGRASLPFLFILPPLLADASTRMTIVIWELAFRAGVNIVMYALTGNYKADQVHVPALLERLRGEGRGLLR